MGPSNLALMFLRIFLLLDDLLLVFVMLGFDVAVPEASFDLCSFVSLGIEEIKILWEFRSDEIEFPFLQSVVQVFQRFRSCSFGNNAKGIIILFVLRICVLRLHRFEKLLLTSPHITRQIISGSMNNIRSERRNCAHKTRPKIDSLQADSELFNKQYTFLPEKQKVKTAAQMPIFWWKARRNLVANLISQLGVLFCKFYF